MHRLFDLPTINLRRAVLWTLFLACAIAVVITALSQTTNLILVIALGIIGIAALIEPASILWDRFGPAPELRKQRPAVAAERSIEAYHNGRLEEFRQNRLEELFVPLHGETTIETRYSSEERDLANIEEAMEIYKGRFVLIGQPGAGKSTTLRTLMKTAIKKYRHNKNSGPVPVWINLGLSDTPIDATELLDHWWNTDSLAFLPDTSSLWIGQHRLCLFMDGLNEMPLDTRKERATSLKAFLDRHPSLPVIVTCRVSDYEADEALNLGLSVVRVHELDDGQIQQFIHQRKCDAALWNEHITKNGALRRWAANPYKLVMLIAVYEATGKPPETLDALYGDYVAQAYEEYQALREKQDNTPLLYLKWPELEPCLKHLAFRMIYKSKGTSADIEWARRCIGAKALWDGLNLGVLLRDGNTIKFFHQSLHGYFGVEKLGNALKVNNRLERFTKDPVALIRQISDLGEAGAPAVPALIITLSDSDVIIRESAADALGNIGDSRAVQPLVTALSDPNLEFRYLAIFALGQIGDSQATEPLISVLADPVSFVRYLAARALGQIADPRAIAPLINALTDTDAVVRLYATAALGRFGDSRAIDSLITTLTDFSSDVRQIAADALGQLGDPRAVEPLIAALADPNWNVRQTTAGALQKIGTPEAYAAIHQYKEGKIIPREA